jgi:hypothetical protein
MPRAKLAIPFPAWVPELARRRINELLVAPAGSDDIAYDLLERLATDEVMKTEVWERLPSEPKGIQGNIVDWVFFAVLIFPRLPRPYPKTKAGWRELAELYQKNSPLPSAESLSDLASLLLDEMRKIKTETDLCWGRLWEGDKATSSDHVVAVLEHLRIFYLRMDEDNRAFLATLPEVKRWKREKPKQKFFTDYLSRRMKQTYGKPFDTIVAALTEVAFDLPQGVETDTVRKRRGIASTPENSKRK